MVMENPGKNRCHGKVLEYENFPKSHGIASPHCCGSFLVFDCHACCETIITISETMCEWESWKKANQSWKTHGILFSDFCVNPV